MEEEEEMFAGFEVVNADVVVVVVVKAAVGVAEDLVSKAGKVKAEESLTRTAPGLTGGDRVEEIDAEDEPRSIAF